MKKENVILWILWALFSTESYLPKWEDEINQYVFEIEHVLGHQLESGYSDHLEAMRPTFDPVVALHRPLVWYLGSTGKFRDANQLTRIVSDRRWCGRVVLGFHSHTRIQTLYHFKMV